MSLKRTIQFHKLKGRLGAARLVQGLLAKAVAVRYLLYSLNVSLPHSGSVLLI